MFKEHIKVVNQDDRASRLSHTLTYLSAILSPLDLISITSIQDSKGCLIVTLDGIYIEKSGILLDASYGKSMYLEYLESKIKAAWAAEGENWVEIVLEGPNDN